MNNKDFNLTQFVENIYDGHKDQRDKYVDSGYYRHLAEVMALTAAAIEDIDTTTLWGYSRKEMLAIAVGHDYIEDVEGLTETEKADRILEWSNQKVLYGISMLTDPDLSFGNRAARKAYVRAKLGQVSGAIQTIKVQDIRSNTRTIMRHDPKFGITYCKEISELLNVFSDAEPNTLALAKAQVRSLLNEG